MSKKNQITATNKTMVMHHRKAEPVFKQAGPRKPAANAEEGKAAKPANKGGNNK